MFITSALLELSGRPTMGVPTESNFRYPKSRSKSFRVAIPLRTLGVLTRGLGVEVEPGARHDGWVQMRGYVFDFTGFARKRWGLYDCNLRGLGDGSKNGDIRCGFGSSLIFCFLFLPLFASVFRFVVLPLFLGLVLSSTSHFLISSPAAMSGLVWGFLGATLVSIWGCIKSKNNNKGVGGRART